jgi:hypothetical protein
MPEEQMPGPRESYMPMPTGASPKGIDEAVDKDEIF